MSQGQPAAFDSDMYSSTAGMYGGVYAHIDLGVVEVIMIAPSWRDSHTYRGRAGDMIAMIVQIPIMQSASIRIALCSAA